MSDDRPKASPEQLRGDAQAIVKRLRDAGHVAYFAGGCVRDLLLKLRPKDFDVATDAIPARVRELFPRSQSVGAAFGVILVHQPHSSVEVATFRSDGSYDDGRHPRSVTFTTAEEDAKRRDFTINGLFLDPLDPLRRDKIIDFVGGQDDLRAGIIRAIGNASDRFAEDHLRILRAIRFAARLGFAIEPTTQSAIDNATPKLIRISPERIADELRRMLAPPTRIAAWSLLRPAIAELLFRFAQPVARDVKSTSLFEVLVPNEPISSSLALVGAWLDRVQLRVASRNQLHEMLTHSRIQDFVRATRQSLRVSNDESDAIRSILRPLSTLLAATALPTIATMKRFLASPTSPQSRQLLAALATVGLIDRDRVTALEACFAKFSADEIAPPPLVTGDDLNAAGFPPGPAFKKALDAIYDAQLEGQVTEKPEALQLALVFFTRSSG